MKRISIPIGNLANTHVLGRVHKSIGQLNFVIGCIGDVCYAAGRHKNPIVGDDGAHAIQWLVPVHDADQRFNVNH